MPEVKMPQAEDTLQEHVIDEELDRLLNNGVSRNTPDYDLINIDRVS